MYMTLKIKIFLFLCFTCKTTLINCHKLESRVDWLIPDHQEVRDLNFFFSIYEVRSSMNPFENFFQLKIEKSLESIVVRKIFLLVVLHLSKAETILGWQCVIVCDTNLGHDRLTVWHKVIKKQECVRVHYIIKRSALYYKIMERYKLLLRNLLFFVFLVGLGLLIFLLIPRAWKKGVSLVSEVNSVWLEEWNISVPVYRFGIIAIIYIYIYKYIHTHLFIYL